MTEHVNTGGNAFPSKVTIPNGQFDPFSGKTAQGNQEYIQMGMTMRDYFAAQALPAIYSDAMRDSLDRRELLMHNDWRTGLALDAYAMADAMLRAREGVL